MKHSLRIMIAGILLLGFSTSFAQTSVSPTNDNIQYFGRWDFSNPNAPYCSWPSLYIKAKFTGTGITANFNNPGVDFIYTIDGGAPQRVNAPANEVSVSGLSAGEHEFMVSRTTEYNGGFLTFNGFTITGGDIVEPEDRPCAKFEFVGNSILCGLAADHPTWDNGNGPWISGTWDQNAYMSWGPQLSRMYDAEYRVESHSGQGMSINLNNSLPEVQASDEFTFKHYYPGWARAGWDQLYDFNADPFEPDFFFCSLGTNDWSDQNYNQGLVTPQNHVVRYNEFIDFVYEKYPNTTFVVMSTLLGVRGWADGNDAIEAMVNDRKAQGDDIYFINMEGWLPNQQDYGNDWTHPTTVGHTTMATNIKAFMDGNAAITAKLNQITSSCNVDCNGILGGDAYYDECDVCVGGNTGVVSTCQKDCAGIDQGTASIDECGVCSGGTTGIEPNSECEQDCNGVWGGTAEEDACGICAGGNTEIVPCGYSACRTLEFEGEDNHDGFGGSWGNFTTEEANGNLTVTTTSTTGQWDAFEVTLGTGVDFNLAASQKIWVRAKASSNVILQPSPKDSKGDVAGNSNLTGGNWNSTNSNVLQLTDQWQEYEINFQGSLSNEWGCACPLIASEIDHILFSINPGYESQWPVNDQFGNPVTVGFDGTIEIDWVKLGSPSCEMLTPIMEENHEGYAISLFPNPTTGFVNLSEATDWTLTNMLGEKINSGYGALIDLNTHVSGMYFIQVGNSVLPVLKK